MSLASKAELGLSFLLQARGFGLGNALFSRAVMHLTNRGVREVFVHCLSKNGAMTPSPIRQASPCTVQGRCYQGRVPTPSCCR